MPWNAIQFSFCQLTSDTLRKSSVIEMDCSRNITDLPLEILDLLFGYCGDMTNKVNLAKTHPYLVQAFAYHCRNLFISEDDKISLSSWQFILPVCGSNIKEMHKIIRDSSDEELVNLVATHCSKLENIGFDFKNSSSVACVKSLICQRQSSLRAIFLRLASQNYLDTKMLHELPELPLLEELKISNIPIEKYYHIQKFENLVKLEIRWWISKFVIDILALCAPLKKLQELALKGMEITASEQNEIHLPVIQLKKLSIECCSILSFPERTIGERNRHADIQRFILSQGKSLESFSYECSGEFYGNEDFLEVIRICRDLRFFELPSRGVVFDLQFVEEIVDILIQNGVTPDNPLLLAAKNYPIFIELAKWLECSSRPDLLKPVYR